jgi:hypothetical protein
MGVEQRWPESVLDGRDDRLALGADRSPDFGSEFARPTAEVQYALARLRVETVEE